MGPLVAKFGGSSLADAAQIRKAAAIIKSGPDRRYVVVSAPGKRGPGDEKVTDLLYQAHALEVGGLDASVPMRSVEERFAKIIQELGISLDLGAELEAIRRSPSPMPDFLVSRGEYLSARILAAYLGFDFVDAAEGVFFREDGRLDEERTYRLLRERLAHSPRAVVPGFYGLGADGGIRTFSRGGSDVTGAIVARAAGARLYENWTDVSGVLCADPRIVKNPKVISSMTYRELRELSYMGASVLHEDAIFPVRAAGIPINIRNTNRPGDPGTLISSSLQGEGSRVTGMAGRKGFTGVVVEKSMMNAEVGFGARLLQIFAEHGVPFEHCPSGIDALSVIVNSETFSAAREAIVAEIKDELAPDGLALFDGLAMIAVVGHGMVRSKGTAARVFKAAAEADINIRMIDQGPSELNIILGVAEEDYEAAFRAIYQELEPLM